MERSHNKNDSFNSDRENTDHDGLFEPSEWPESPPHLAVAASSLPAVIQNQTDNYSVIATDPIPTRNPTGPTIGSNRSNTELSLRLRKRSKKNEVEANAQKRKKSSNHALADAIHTTADVLERSNKMLTDQLIRGGDLSSQIADIIVTEFKDLLVEEQAFVNSVLENRSKASLFLAWTLEQRNIWVEQVLERRQESLN